MATDIDPAWLAEVERSAERRLSGGSHFDLTIDDAQRCEAVVALASAYREQTTLLALLRDELVSIGARLSKREEHVRVLVLAGDGGGRRGGAAVVRVRIAQPPREDGGEWPVRCPHRPRPDQGDVMDLRENGHFTDCTCRECRLEAERDALRAQLAAADIAQEKNEGCGEIADIEEAATKTGPYRAAGRFVRDASGVLITKCASRATALMIEACLNDDQATTTRRACAAELRDKAEKLRKRTADTGAWEWAARLLEGYADRWEGRALSRSLAAGPAQPGEEE